MSTSTSVQVRVDKALKADAERLFADIGLDMPTAIRLFLKQSVIKNGLPFPVERDPFYSVKNLEALRRSAAQMETGEVVTKSLDELRSME